MVKSGKLFGIRRGYSYLYTELRRCVMGELGRAIRRFMTCESGATATEYAVMLALIFLVIIGAVTVLGTKVSSTFVDAESGF